MRQRLQTFTLMLLLSIAGTVNAAPEYAEGGANTCLSCHDFGNESPVHAMLAGAHGQQDNSKTPMGQKGCEDCHGPSASHSKAPTQIAPAVSFGPRWSASPADQDASCLACHEDNVAKHWRDALHMLNNLTCVTCHDVHQPDDRVLHSATQASVCTVCHKPQKSGMHALEKHPDNNPACTNCHNPHDHESAAGAMLDNRSLGCRSCHDLVAMASNPKISEKATSYHKVMTQADRTCLDCHQGIAHSSTAGVKPLIQESASTRTASLFIPGQSDSEWLLTEHPGSQPLRHGSNCQQCHRGEEASMAEAINTGASREIRNVRMAFSRDDTHLKLSLSWDGTQDDIDVSVMWGDNKNIPFQRGGCFAACHSDMPGMSKDRGQQQEKYLMASKAQQQKIGQPAISRDRAELEQMMTAGNFVELWRVTLNSGNPEVQSAALLSKPNWHANSTLQGSASHANGRWSVSLQRPLMAGKGHKDFTPDGKYTLGVALRGAKQSGGLHWVSLPMTFSLQGDDTDFKAQ